MNTVKHTWKTYIIFLLVYIFRGSSNITYYFYNSKRFVQSQIMKVELTMQYLDEWMLRWRKFQTESDLAIERDRQRWRKYAIASTVGVAAYLTLLTSGRATINRQFGAPHFFDIGIDSAIKSAIRKTINSFWRYTPQGNMRLIFVAAPAYANFVALEHMSEKRRLYYYLLQDTVFGEQARRLINTGKIEEYLAVNIQATLPAA